MFCCCTGTGKGVVDNVEFARCVVAVIVMIECKLCTAGGTSCADEGIWYMLTLDGGSCIDGVVAI